MMSIRRQQMYADAGAEHRDPGNKPIRGQYWGHVTCLDQSQRAIGADIMMQLDDVVDATNQDPERFEEARHRTVRWLDRCLEVHTRPDTQNLFPIVQGGLDEE